MADTYDFSENFQIKICALILKDRDTLTRYGSIIVPEYFEFENLQIIVRLIRGYFYSKSEVPSKEVLDELISDYQKKYSLEQDLVKKLLDTSDTIANTSTSDRDYVLEKVKLFAKRQGWKTFILNAISTVKSTSNLEQMDAIADEAEKVRRIGIDADLGMDFHSSVQNFAEVLKNSKMYKSSEKIPLGLPSLDASLGGGVSKGEIMTIIAPPKRGKSTALVNFGAAGARAGKNICHITLELKEEDILMKYLGRFTGKAINDIIVDYSVSNQLPSNPMLEGSMKDRLMIKYFPPFSITAQDLTSYLETLKSLKGFSPDAVIIDYASRLKMDRSNMYNSIGEVYDRLIALGDKLDCAVYTAIQSNRAAWRTGDVDADNAADSAQAMHNVDIALAIKQSLDEKQANKMRIGTPLVRRGESGKDVFCDVDYAACVITEAEA